MQISRPHDPMTKGLGRHLGLLCAWPYFVFLNKMRFYTRRCTTNPWQSLHTSNYRFARSFRWPNSIHRVNALRFTCPATDGRARCGTFKRHSGCRRPRAVSVPATCREHAARVHPLHHGKQKMRSTLQTLLRFSSSRCGTSLPEKCNSFFFFFAPYYFQLCKSLLPSLAGVFELRENVTWVWLEWGT